MDGPYFAGWVELSATQHPQQETECWVAAREVAMLDPAYGASIPH